jgi:hypothetical protein
MCRPTDFSAPSAILWLGAASLDSFEDLAFGSLRDPV